MAQLDYRPFVPGPGETRIAGADAREHTAARLRSPRPQQLFAEWAALADRPFHGLTDDGSKREGLFALKPEGAPVEAMAAAAGRLLEALSPGERARTLHPVGSPLWRRWQNTEMLVEDYGLRLESAAPPLRELAMQTIRASLSEAGYAAGRGAMRLNAFLGEVLGAPGVLNEWSYSFCLFGTPSTAEPWGWQLFGHHLALNCLTVGGQMVLTPCFLGAEITAADTGPHAGLRLFRDHERRGLDLMNALPPAQRDRALVGRSILGDGLPPGRRHFADHLHLGGAFRDNRIVPYEGLVAASMDAPRRRMLTDLAGEYLAILPDGPRQARLEAFARHLEATHFCWIGGTGAADAFYYRIQSPVLFIEFDMHGGVFLTNREPAKFHVHTIVRTPNGNDYGIDLLRQHYRRSHEGRNSRREEPLRGGTVEGTAHRHEHGERDG